VINLKDIIKNISTVDTKSYKLDNKNQHNTINLKQKNSTLNADEIICGNQYNEYHIHFDNTDDKNIKDLIDINYERKSLFDKETVVHYQESDIPSQISLLLKEAESLQKIRKFNEALKIYLDISTDPSVSNLLPQKARFTINLNVGICYFNLISTPNYLEEAKKYIDRAYGLKEGQDEERIYLVLSWYYKEIGNNVLSKTMLNEAIKINPEYIRAINMRALIRKEEGEKLEEILKDYFDENGELKELFKENENVFINLGQLFYMAKKNDDAIEWFEKAKERIGDDFIVIALLGNSYFFKSLKGKEYLNDFNINKDINFEALCRSWELFKNAFEIAESVGLDATLKPFILNFSTASILIGKYKDVIDKLNKAIKLGISDDDLLRNKAKIEAISGSTDEAKKILQRLSDKNSSINFSLILFSEGRYTEAINNLRKTLMEDSLEDEDIEFCEALLCECLIKNSETPEALKILNKIKKESRDTWRSDLVWGKYYEHIGNISESEKYHTKALKISENHPYAFIETVIFLGRNKQYQKSIELLKASFNMPFFHVMKQDVYLFLAKSYFFIDDYESAINIIEEASKENVEKQIFTEILIECYMRLKNYSEAQLILEKTYYKDPLKDSNILNLSTCLALQGKIEESIRLYNKAEKLEKIKKDSKFYMQYSQLSLLNEDKESALKYAEKAKDIDIDIPKSSAHSFYMQMSLRCGKTDQTVEYMMDYHSSFPKEMLVKTIKAVEDKNGNEKQLTDEFKNELLKINERFQFLINQYKTNPFPLHFLSRFFNRTLNEVYYWRIIYGIPIYVDSGSPYLHKSEIENLQTTETLLVDNVALMILNELGLIDELFKEFNQIIIPQSLFEEIQNNILLVEDPKNIKLWKTLKSNPKVLFCHIQTDFDFLSKGFLDFIGQATFDCLNIAKKEGHIYCAGDDRLKRLAYKEKLKVTGIYALLINLHKKGAIDGNTLSKYKLKLLSENHTFISFNSDDLLNITRERQYECGDELDIFFDTIFKEQPNITSFVAVFRETLMRMIMYGIKANVLAGWIFKYIEIYQRIFKNEYTAHNFPHLFQKRPKENYRGHEIDIIEICMLALIDILLIIESNIKEQNEKKILYDTFYNTINHSELFQIYNNEMIEFVKDTIKRKESFGVVNG